jgi:hypothetical protein
MSKKPSAGDPKPPPWLPDYRRQIECLKKIVTAARFLIGQINAGFPVEGEPWNYEDDPGNCGPEVNVINAARDLDKLLYPLCLPFGATSYDHVRLLNGGTFPKRLGERKTITDLKSSLFRANASNTVYAFASFVGDPQAIINYVKTNEAARHVPAALHTAIRGTMLAHDRLLRHYKWGTEVTWQPGARGALPRRWHWPDVPAVPQGHLDSLARAADHLDELLKASWSALAPSQPAAAARPPGTKARKPRSGNEARDGYCYEQLKAGTPLKRIQEMLNARKDWEPLCTEQAVSQAARRYAERHGKPWPV